MSPVFIAALVVAGCTHGDDMDSGASTGGSDPHSPRWTAVSAGRYVSCALDADGRPTCWGMDEVVAATPDVSGLVELSTTNHTSCGIDIGGMTTCWGGEELDPDVVPDFPVTAVMVNAAGRVCAIPQGGGDRYCSNGIDRVVPSGEYDLITPTSDFSGCGRKSGEDSLTCWHDQQGTFDGPEGDFTAIACVTWECCALDVDGEVTCGISHPDHVFSNDGDDILGTPPAGPWKSIAADDGTMCMIDDEGAISCLFKSELNEKEMGDIPDGTFVDLDVGKYHACALDTDGEISCWGRRTSAGELDVPEED